jgi:hypothetical protein
MYFLPHILLLSSPFRFFSSAFRFFSSSFRFLASGSSSSDADLLRSIDLVVTGTTGVIREGVSPIEKPHLYLQVAWWNVFWPWKTLLLFFSIGRRQVDFL